MYKSCIINYTEWSRRSNVLVWRIHAYVTDDVFGYRIYWKQLNLEKKIMKTGCVQHGMRCIYLSRWKGQDRYVHVDCRPETSVKMSPHSAVRSSAWRLTVFSSLLWTSNRNVWRQFDRCHRTINWSWALPYRTLCVILSLKQYSVGKLCAVVSNVFCVLHHVSAVV